MLQKRLDFFFAEVEFVLPKVPIIDEIVFVDSCEIRIHENRSLESSEKSVVNIAEGIHVRRHIGRVTNCDIRKSISPRGVESQKTMPERRGGIEK